MVISENEKTNEKKKLLQFVLKLRRKPAAVASSGSDGPHVVLCRSMTNA